MYMCQLGSLCPGSCQCVCPEHVSLCHLQINSEYVSVFDPGNCIPLCTCSSKARLSEDHNQLLSSH